MEAINIRPAPEFSTREPGIYANVPESIYHALDACSNSRLSDLEEKAPARCRWEWDHPEPSTDNQLLGRAIHSAILEPDEFARRYYPLPKGFTRRSNADKAQYEVWCGEFGADYVIKAEAYEMALEIKGKVRLHRAAGRLLDMEGPTELSVLWRDEERDLLCKARIDKWIPGLSTIVDLKSTQNAHPVSFAADVFKFKYYRQSAFYPAALHAHGIETKGFVDIAAEKHPPYCPAAYRMGDEDVDAGWTALNPLLDRYAEYHASGVWPGYDEAVQDLSMPAWAHRRIEEQLL